MNAVARPKGPLSPRVYWTRRLMVSGTAFALVFAIARLLGGGSDGSSDSVGAASAVVGDQVTTAPTGATTGPTTAPSKAATPKKPGKGKPKPPPLAQPDGPCDDAEVSITPVVAKAHAGGDVAIGLQVRSTSSAACTWLVSPDSVAVKITSGSDFIWSSQDCPKALPTQAVIARRAVPAQVQVVWNGKRSNDTCGSTTNWALPGWYHVFSAVLGGQQAQVQFELEDATPITITQTVTPHPSRTPTTSPGQGSASQPTHQPTGSPSGAVEPD